jgi:membrane protein DedA with SNARE-associated domain
LFDQIENLIDGIRAFILGQPLLFVLVSGLIASLLSVVGESVTYWAARLGGRALIHRFSRWLRVDTRHMNRTETMFLRWGVGLVLFGRILPGVRTLVSVPAGMTRMNFGLFFAASFGGAYLWNTLLVGVSYLLGFKLTLFGMSISM